MNADVLFVILNLSAAAQSELDSLKFKCNCEFPVSCHTNKYFREKITDKTKVFYGECEHLEPSEVSEVELSWAVEGITRNFSEFTNLITLKIAHSVITHLKPDTLSGLPKVEKLSLIRNGIKELSEISELESLKKLFLAGNKVEVIRKNTFRNLPDLTFLTLESNEIYFIHCDAFSNNKLLEDLNLNRNDLRFLEPGTFLNNWNLKEVSLNHNKLKRLSVDTFASSVRLEVLRLHGNKLQRLERNTFERNLNLRWIELGQNELTFIDSMVFQELKSLSFVDFSENICIDGSFPTDMRREHLLALIKRNCHYLAIV